MTRRAIVYIDYENAYRNARDFFHNGDPGDDRTNGHFKPRALAEVLCERYSAMFPARESLNLEAVRVFRGRPVPRYEAAAASAWRRQAEAWEAEGVSITHIPLHYDPQGRGREKGVDILLALHLVMDAVERNCDAAILFSRDSDFEPVPGMVGRLPAPRPVVLAGGWTSGRRHSAFPTRERPLLIGPAAYHEQCADTTVYLTLHQGKPATKTQRRRRKRQRGKRSAG